MSSGCFNDTPGERDTRLVIPGTGACEEILKYAAARFNRLNSGLTVGVPISSGSSGGIRAVGQGEAALARVARQIKQDEAPYGLSYQVFAKDAVVFAVGDDVTVTDLSAAQLADIFSGKIENWRDVGGPDAPIRVLYREEGDSSLSVIRQYLTPFRGLEFTKRAKCAYHDHEMTGLLSKYPTSIGFLTNSTARAPGNEIRTIMVDGVAPTVEHVLSGAYPFVCQYALVYKEKEVNPLAQAFIQFIFSDAGRQVFIEHHVVPHPGE
jgi:phosphate transport system substrate-binding protein